MSSQTLFNIPQHLSKLTRAWQPELIESGDFRFRLVKVLGDYGWHVHQSDKVILVFSGELGLALRDEDGNENIIKIGENSCYVVPKNVEHKPFAERSTSIMLIEIAELEEPV